jgi:hypothetical protein
VVADIRRIMASAAKAWNGFNIEVVVKARNASDINFSVVEQFLATRH